ncbi:unnamed protein product, partial [Coccothraustes coccothraustes]
RIQPGLGHCQGSRGRHSKSGNSSPAPAHPPSQQFLAKIPAQSPLSQWQPFPGSCPSVPCPQSLSSSPRAPPGPGKGSKFSLEFFLLQGNIPSSPSQGPSRA